MAELVSERAGAERWVRLGGLAWLLGVIQFVATMIVVQLAWTHPYNPLQNAVSDLGAVTCHENPMGTSFVCSPWHVAFNVSIIAFGILVAAGAIAARPGLPPGRIAQCGAAVLVVAGVGAVLVGVFPEDVQGVAHSLGALLAFVGSSIALILLGIAMSRRRGWGGYRALSLGCGVFSGGVIVASNVSENWGPVGFGGLERLIVAPALLWLFVVGIRLSRGTSLEGSTGDTARGRVRPPATLAGELRAP